MNDDFWNRARRIGDAVRIDLEYPESEGHAKYIELGLMAVRAADSIRISYDFDRDGYRIEQHPHVEEKGGGYIREEGDWQEVAFVKAWGLMREESKP